MARIKRLFSKILQSGLSGHAGLTFVPTEEEWGGVFEVVQMQAIGGICSVGVQTILASPSPVDGGTGYASWGMSQITFLEWLGLAGSARKNNEKVEDDLRCAVEKFEADGLQGCLLKGLSLRKYYPEHLQGLRECGDIDFLADKKDIDVLRYAYKLEGKDMEWSYKHVHLNILEESYVDLHYRLAMSRNLCRNNKMQAWCDEIKRRGFVKDSGSICATLNDDDNLVFLLLHAMWHFLFEGIGLRHMMDIYYVSRCIYESHNNAERENVMKLIKRFDLEKFASACSWLMWHMFEADDEKSFLLSADSPLPAPDKKEGKFMLNEIMTTGNFGHWDERNTISADDNTIIKYCKKMKYYARYAKRYPSEFLWLPISSLYIRFWRRRMMRLGFATSKQ